MRDGGNQWSGWVAYLSFFRHVAKLELPEYAKFKHYETGATGGPRFLHERFWMLSELPDCVHRDDAHRPHCETGPALRWRDGWALYFWHGVRVPVAWIEQRATLDPKVALTWPNVEQRRAAAEIIGWQKVLSRVGSRVVDQDKDPSIGTLLECDLPGSAGSRFLQVLCGTGRTFVLPVPREMTTALEANSWTYGLDSHELQLEART